MFESDHIAGRILDALDKAGVTDNTIIIFTADNGPEHYAYKRDEVFEHWSAKPLRGLKRDIYEGGHRVPFIVRWPGLTQAGETKQARTSHIHNTFSHSWAIRDGDWLLIDAKSGAHSKNGIAQWEKRLGYESDSLDVELYNLRDDIGQKNNLAQKHPGKVKAMQALMKKIREESRSRPALSN